jgi:putative transposase
MNTSFYPSDLTDDQWALLEPLIPVFSRGRPRTTSMRAVVNAILYLLRTGCQWQYLPHDFPPKSTVWEYYHAWRQDGTLSKIHDTLREQVRHQEAPHRPRRTASIDSQSVNTSSGGSERGRDNAKKINGRKRHILVDSLGLLLAVAVTAANVDDAAAAPALLQQLAKPPLGHIRRVFADSKYHNYNLYAWVDEQEQYQMHIIHRPKDAEGWVRLPKRWTVERTFGWFTKCRRLSLDRERKPESSQAMIQWAMVHLMLKRLRPANNEAEFHYRQAA